MSIKVIYPFGPTMAKIKLTNTIIKKINSEVDKIVSNPLLSKKYNYANKLAGEVEQEIELPTSFTNKYLKSTLQSSIKAFVKKVLVKYLNK